MVRYKMEDLRREEKAMEKQDAEVPVENIEMEDESPDDEGTDSDSEWEDIEYISDLEETPYNPMSLKYFAMECDRYCLSDRAGAKIGNGLLKDLGIVKRGCIYKH